MLARRHRVTSPAEFKRVIRAGRKVARGSVVVHVLLPSSLTGSDVPARMGVTVSKAVGGSVVRHRVARVIRHAMGRELRDVPAGSLWVIRALPGASAAAESARGAQAVVADIQAAVAAVTSSSAR